MVSFSGRISLTSVLTLYIMSLTCARISLFDSIVSFIESSISLFSSSNWASTVPCVLASESILSRKVSTGFAKAIAHVMPHKTKVAAALAQKHVIGVMACSFSFMKG